MNQDPRQQTGQAGTAPTPAQGCTIDPARQPKPAAPPGQCRPPAPGPAAPVPPTPKHDCPPPECCPKPAGATPTCLEQLIADQQNLIAQAERAKLFKTELEGLQQKAKAAKADYTEDKYLALLERWKEQDKQIAALIADVVCSAKHWRTQIECFVCPLLYEIRLLMQQLHGDGTLYGEVGSLYDLRYWRQRDKDAKQARFDRIKDVLAAWEKPAQTIDKVLGDNAKLIDATGKSLGAADRGKLLYDVFMRLVPMHLSIAPPASVATTKIDKKYTELCKCDTGKPDDCCGPDTGAPSVLQRLLGPQPYLVHPDQYYAIVCCLAQTRYLPAKEELAKAEADLQGVEDEIKRVTAAIEEKKKSLEASAKGELAKPFECCKPTPPPDGTTAPCPPAGSPPQPTGSAA